MTDPSTPPADSQELDAALDHRIMRASAWIAASFGSGQIIGFATTVVLLRLLKPADFGLAALAVTVLAVVQVVQESGVGAALVHRRTELERAATSSFFFAVTASLLLYAVAFAAAPLAATAFHQRRLTEVVRVLALLMIFRGLSVVPGALLERKLDFRLRTVSDVTAAICQAAVSIGLAVSGAGVWSLVFGQLAASAASAAALWMLVSWRPAWRDFDRTVLRELLRYGRFVSASNVLVIVTNSVDNVVVGRLLPAAQLGFYAVAWRICEIPVVVIGTIVGRVMFPVYAGLQHDLAQIRRGYVQNLQRLALLSVPVTVGLAVTAEPFVRVVMGDQWLSSVNVIRLLAIFAVLRSLVGPTGELFKGAGKPHLNLVSGLIYPTLALPSLILLTHHYGIVGAACAVVGSMALTSSVTMTLARRLLDLRLTRLLRALAPSLLCTALMAVSMIVTVEATASTSPAKSLAAAVAIGVFVYIGSTAIFARGIVLSMWRALRGPAGPSRAASA